MMTTLGYAFEDLSVFISKRSLRHYDRPSAQSKLDPPIKENFTARFKRFVKKFGERAPLG